MSTFDPAGNVPHAEPNPTGFEICRATVALMFLLEGMESVRDARGSDMTASFPLLGKLAVPLALQGEPVELLDVLAPGAEAEQLAYQAWLDRTVRLTESDSDSPAEPAEYTQLAEELRLIRRDLISNGGIASAEGSGRCTRLAWFRAGEPILLGLPHVLDLLNQRGLISAASVLHPSGVEAKWLRPLLAARERSDDEAPPLVSLREISPRDNGSSGDPGSLVAVFADGVALELSIPDTATRRRNQAKQTGPARIDEQGDLVLGDGTRLDRGGLYQEALNRMLNT